MYERSAIVLERCFERLFKFNQENNLKENYESFCDLVEQIKEYQKTSVEEENVIEKFDDIASKIETIQRNQTKLNESNLELEQERNRLFNDLGENPNALDSKLRTIEKTLNANNENLGRLREEYVEALVIFTERQKERNKYARLRRKVEATHINNIENATKVFEEISPKDVHAFKRFVTAEKEQYKEKIINTMIKNGNNEKVPFNNKVIELAVKVRIDIAEKEAELYVSIYERMKKLLIELESENIKVAKIEKLARDVGVKLNMLNAKKEYIVGFLDNERLTAMNGQQAHDHLMEQACKDFEADIKQIDNLYELVIKETTGKSTKKAYNELYNKTYLRDIEQKEKSFEREVTNLRINMGTVINSNYWRIEGIKNVYTVFQNEVTEKFNKDLSEYQIVEEPEKIQLEELENDDDDFELEFKQINSRKKTSTKKSKHSKNNFEEDEEEEEKEDDLYKDIDDFDFDFDDDDDDDFDYNFDDDEDDEDDKDDDIDYEDSDDFDDDYEDEDDNFGNDYDDDDYDYDDYDDEDDDDYDYDDEEEEEENKRKTVNDEFFDEKIDRIIMKSRQKLADKQEARKDKGLLNKLFKKKDKKEA